MWLAYKHFIAIAIFLVTATSHANFVTNFNELELQRPQKGSILGSLQQFNPELDSMTDGSVSIPLELDLPKAQGGLLHNPFPSYSISGGMEEWGMGFSSKLAVTRWREFGELNYIDDYFVSPWGVLRPGIDGFWYGKKSSGLVRANINNDSATIITPDGLYYEFSAIEMGLYGIYSYKLTKVSDPYGNSTVLAWLANDSGKLFLNTINYGGLGDQHAYLVELEYQSYESIHVVSYKSGQARLLDRLIKSISIYNIDDDELHLRWRYDLGYRFSELGPFAHLVSIQKTYFSGLTDRSLQFDYYFHDDYITTADFEFNQALTDLYLGVEREIPLHGVDAVFYDFNLDGLTDFENAGTRTRYVQQADGNFVKIPLKKLHSRAVPKLCRRSEGPGSRPAEYLRLRGPYTEKHRVSIKDVNGVAVITECDPDGQILSEYHIPDATYLGINDAFIDMNQDGKPDIVYGGTHSIKIYENTSTKSEVSFIRHDIDNEGRFHLSDKLQYVDVNGDGFIDIVTMDTISFTIYYGISQFQFSEGVTARFIGTHGGDSDPSYYSLKFADLNKDGLKDLVARRSPYILLFFNNGKDFIQKKIPAIYNKLFSRFDSHVANLTGGANQELIVSSKTATKVLELNQTSTSYLKSIDDGKGNTLSFRYKYIPGVKNLGSGKLVIDSMTHKSAGMDAMVNTISYENPIASNTKYQHLGFSRLMQVSSLHRSVREFNISELQGIILKSQTQTDRKSSILEKSVNFSNEEFFFKGVNFKRTITKSSYWKGGTKRYEEIRDFVNGLCPQVIILATSSFTKTTTIDYQMPSQIAQSLGCYSKMIKQTAKHSDPRLDFEHITALKRTPYGELNEIRKISGVSSIVHATLSFDDYGRNTSITRPGLGTTSARYDTEKNLLHNLTNPNGVITSVTSRDPLTELPNAITQERGDSRYFQYFSYDGKERLARQWDSLTATSAALPLIGYHYQEYEPGILGRITSSRLTPNLLTKGTTKLLSSNGKLLATAITANPHYILEGITKISRSEGITKTYRPLAISSLPDLMTDYFPDDEMIAEEEKNSLGVLSFDIYIDADSKRSIEKIFQISGQNLITTSIENRLYRTSLTTGPQDEVTSFTDEDGYSYHFAYDADQKLNLVALPHGSQHIVEYDEFGRKSRVFRDDIGGIQYAYRAGTDLLENVDLLDKNGHTYASKSISYDSIGRIIQESLTSDGNQAYVRYDYDGHTTHPPLKIPGQKGLLSQVTGNDFTKTFQYSLNKKLQVKRTEISDFAILTETFHYYDSGEVKTNIANLELTNGKDISVSKEWIYDNYGRIAKLKLGATELLQVHYNSLNQVSSIDIFHDLGHKIEFFYDPLNYEYTGHCVDSSCYLLTKNSRGLIERESVNDLERNYHYNSRGFLTEVNEGSQRASYAYDANGLNTEHSQNYQTYPIETLQHGFKIGSHSYTFDAQGRLSSLNDMIFQYGPQNQISTVIKGSNSISYLYDETGQRILKTDAHGDKLAWIDDYTVKDGALFEIVRINNIAIGYLKNGQFRLLLSDSRGSRLDGSNWSDPYGNRLDDLTESEFWDYTEKSRDTFTGFVRLGLRDLDSSSGRFTSPDPLFLSSPALCIQSPPECNLYSYAANSSLNHTDPTGTVADDSIGPLSRPFNTLEEAADFRHNAGAFMTIAADTLEDLRPLPDLWGLRSLLKYSGSALVTSARKTVRTQTDQASSELIRFAKSLQGEGLYPGVDKYRQIVLKEGKVIFGGVPGQSNFYTTAKAIASSQHNANSLFRGLQVARHKEFGYRPGMTAYRVKKEIPVAFGRAIENKVHGHGGLPQIVLKEYESYLEPIYSVKLD